MEKNQITPEPDLTEDERERVEMWLHDALQGTMYDIARDLGLPEGDWTEEQQALINAEHDRRAKPRIIAAVLADRSSSDPATPASPAD